MCRLSRNHVFIFVRSFTCIFPAPEPISPQAIQSVMYMEKYLRKLSACAAEHSPDIHSNDVPAIPGHCSGHTVKPQAQMIRMCNGNRQPCNLPSWPDIIFVVLRFFCDVLWNRHCRRISAGSPPSSRQAEFGAKRERFFRRGTCHSHRLGIPNMQKARCNLHRASVSKNLTHWQSVKKGRSRDLF